MKRANTILRLSVSLSVSLLTALSSLSVVWAANAVDDTATGDNAGPGDTYVSVTVSGADVTGVNFGFAYNLIVNRTDDAGADNIRSTQGSLRQFIKNANAIGTANGTTANVSQFRVPNSLLDGNGVASIIPLAA